MRENIPDSVKLLSNIGDTDLEYFLRLKDLGMDGAYHVIRLGEGEYTSIDPARRQKTIDAIQEAGLIVQDCLEPIGAEHTPEVLADHLDPPRHARRSLPCGRRASLWPAAQRAVGGGPRNITAASARLAYT